MRQTHDAITQHVAERWCGEVARRDATRIAQRWDRQQAIAGVYRLEEGAVWAELFHWLQRIGGMALLAQAHGAASQQEMGPYLQDVWRDGRQTLCGIERMQALPPLWFSAEALMPLGGCKAP